MRKERTTRKWILGAALLLSLLLLAGLLTACKGKDIVSLARLDKGDLYVTDKYGNSVMVADAGRFLSVLKKAERIKAGTGDSVDLTRATHYLWTGQERVYYDWENKQAIVVDAKGNKTVFSVDLRDLLLAIPGLPPVITEGTASNPAIASGFDEISKVDSPSAAVFKTGDGAIVMVAAGKKPSGGYTMSLENAKVGLGGVVELTVRLNPPAGPATAQISYPYLELSLEKYADLEVTLVYTEDGSERYEKVNLAVVEPGQEIVVFKPYRGALLTERVQMYGFARWDLGAFMVTVHDGHSVLGSKEVKVTHSLPAGAPEPTWSAFNFMMDLHQAGSPSGMVEFAKGGNILVRIPVSFGGK